MQRIIEHVLGKLRASESGESKELTELEAALQRAGGHRVSKPPPPPPPPALLAGLGGHGQAGVESDLFIRVR